MKPFFSILILLISLNVSVSAQGFIGASVASIQSKARPDSVVLREMNGYYVEHLSEGHDAIYYVTGFAEGETCTGYEYLAPLSEKPMLTEWLNRFYVKKSADAWRSHNGIVLSLTTEGDQVRLSESKPVAAPAAPAPPASQKYLVKGSWVSTDDKNSTLLITDKQYIDKYKGRAADIYSLTILDKPCNAKPSAKPDGSVYLKIASTNPELEDECYYVVAVSATKLEISAVGQANTFRFNRVSPPSAKK